MPPQSPPGVGPVRPGAGVAFDVGKLNRADALFGGASFLLFISMFFSWYTFNYSSSISGDVSGSGSINGFDGWRYLIFLLALAGMAYVVAKAIGMLPRLSFPNWQVMGAIGVAEIVLVILAFVTKPSASYSSAFGGYHWSWGFGLFVGFIMSIAAVGAAYWDKSGAPAVK
jgi:cellobiose-specific phosphotransferase system component IIC